MFPVQTSAVRSHSYSAVFCGLVSGLFVPNIIPSSVSPYCLRESIVISPKSFSRGYTHSVYVRVSISSLTSQETRLNIRSDLHTSVIGRCQTSGFELFGLENHKMRTAFSKQQFGSLVHIHTTYTRLVRCLKSKWLLWLVLVKWRFYKEAALHCHHDIIR